jgi:hypothetical protein
MEVAKSTGAGDSKNVIDRKHSREHRVRCSTAWHEAHVETDFVRSIRGQILNAAEQDEEKDIGHVDVTGAITEAMDHDINADRPGDGINAGFSEYWERLFDTHEGGLKED